MASGQQGAVIHDVRRLFDAGTVAGLGEGELLERFAATRDDAAFAALLARHGPMVLGVCRRRLPDPRDAEDAFQATVLVLIRKAGSIREPHLLGPWLHGVACKVTQRARKVAARRAGREPSGGIALEVEAAGRPPGESEELRAALDQEIGRLPEALRLPIVLCHLEGLTQPEAALRLRTTPDTVRGRLARAREKLRDRLTRRGLAPAGGLLALDLAAESAPAAPPAPLIEASLRMVEAGAVPTASVATLTDGVIRAMTLDRLRTIATALIGVVAVAAAAAGFAARKADDAPKAVASPPPVAEKPPASPEDQPRSILVEARDLITDAIVPDAQLELSIFTGAERLPALRGTPGSARFDLPEKVEVRHLKLRASRPGYVPVAIDWAYDSEKSTTPPDRFLFQMEKGTTVGGRVLDEAGQPVAGATVALTVNKKYPRSEQWVMINQEFATTDPGGRWSFSGVPERPDSVELAAFHPLHLSDRTFFLTAEFKDQGALRDGTAVLGIDPRGTPISGEVLLPDGRPAPGAEVFHGAGRRYGNSIPPIKADASGRFSIGIKPGTITSVTARVPGFGPVGQELRVGLEPKRVTLKLTSPRVLGGRVVDRTGKPIAGATLSVGWSPVGQADRGRGSEAIAEEFTTDLDGRFAWADAPEGGAHAEAWAPGYLGTQDIRLAPGPENLIELTLATTVKGTVVDVETGRPVPRFTLTYATVRNPGETMIWQRIAGMDKAARKGPGAFEYRFDHAMHQLLVRVEGEGYLPGDSGLFSPDGSPREFTFRLQKADPIRGRVANPDGSPARGAVVYLVPADEQVRLVNGQLTRNDRDVTIQAKVGPDGRFALPPRRDDFLIFALSDAGIVVARRGELLGADALRLRAWARVAGTLKGDGPSAGIELSQWSDDDARSAGLEEPRLSQQYHARVDGAGRFEFPRVAPGRQTFGQWVPNGAAGRLWFVGMASIDAEPGRSYDLKIGEDGRAISGKLALPAGAPWMVRTASVEPSGAKVGKTWRGVHVWEDGRFRVWDLPPGEYSLKIDVHEPPGGDECGWGRLIARFSRSFTVIGGAADGHLDLGTLEPVAVGGKSLQVGEFAPDLPAKTLDGKDFRLADHRGKFVLLDFWATWCAPCLAEIPNLKAARDAFAADPRLEVVSVSVDEDPADARRFVESEKLPWRQAHLDPESPAVAAYGATAIPATFLIGPDGRVLARDLRGAGIRAAMEQYLKN